MNNVDFFNAYRTSLYEGFLEEKHLPQATLGNFRKIKEILDKNEDDFISGRIETEALVSSVSKEINTDLSIQWNPGRDLCILGSMALGGALLAAWVASGGTLIIGTAAAGVTVTGPLMAALVGGASAGTLACILGSCGDC
ncbi:hypothetical protein [Pseudomonas chlororaphis]|uniref:hypothetical protein n=1 Tax=Pseudomonas chlororaphis TaxID=587753 RepID=UPI000F567E6B|nr:hypothetical protein [Pseudomonas chlororaphis]